MYQLKVALVLMAILLLSGCSQKVQIRALAPAEIGEMASKKNVAVSSFKYDKIGLSGKIESKIASQKLNRKRYFNVVSRKDINKVINEQKLQGSELMDESTTTRVGKLIGAQAMINGEVTSAIAKDGKYSKKKKRCKEYDK